MMQFPSLEWMQVWQQKCNASIDFSTATMWSDVKMVIAFGSKRYWLKLYKGKIIDLMEELPGKGLPRNPLGYDIIIRGSVDGWESVKERRSNFWQALGGGDLEIDGNGLETNRMIEAICIMCEDILPETR